MSLSLALGIIFCNSFFDLQSLPRQAFTQIIMICFIVLYCNVLCFVSYHVIMLPYVVNKKGWIAQTHINFYVFSHAAATAADII